MAKKSVVSLCKTLHNQGKSIEDIIAYLKHLSIKINYDEDGIKKVCNYILQGVEDRTWTKLEINYLFENYDKMDIYQLSVNLNRTPESCEQHYSLKNEKQVLVEKRSTATPSINSKLLETQQETVELLKLQIELMKELNSLIRKQISDNSAILLQLRKSSVV